MKAVYTLNEDGFSAYWFEGSKHKEKAIVWMHGSAMNEKHCLADSLYLREAGYSVLVLGFYYWKGMSKKMRAIPVEYVERAASELKKNGYEKIGIHGISSGAAYALLCASLIPDISLDSGSTESRIQSIWVNSCGRFMSTQRLRKNPESWKKAFPAEKKWPKECNEARKDCFEQEFRFLEGWQS